MVINTQKLKQAIFYLYSNKNCHFYSPSKYPLTHLIGRQTIERRLLKQAKYVKHFLYSFIFLITFILISMIFFQGHIYVYNSLFGPFHLNFEEFIKHVETYQTNQSCFWKKEYIQLELGEYNFQIPFDKYKIIREYSDPLTRQNHIATFKYLKTPRIYMTLPTFQQKHTRARLRFDFLSYSVSTLQCIVRNLPSNSMLRYRTWVKKTEYVNYINEQYKGNITYFNTVVVRECGILIGYLYKPVDEKGFLGTREYEFYSYDIAFNRTHHYYSFDKLFIYGLIFIGLLLIYLFNFTIYVLNIIDFKLFNKFGLLLFSLDLDSDVLEELWLLNIDNLPHEQLLQLDEFIRQSKHIYNNQLFIIKNYSQHLFVIILRKNLNENLNIHDQLSPFIICPVTDIRKITEYGGICYGQDLSWISWPTMLPNEQNSSDWLHEELIQISQHYKEQYEYRLQYERENEYEYQRDHQDWNYSYDTINYDQIHQRRIPIKTRTEHLTDLEKFIREEENFQRLKRERQQLIQRIFECTNPASPKFIAYFRIRETNNNNKICSIMAQNNIKCIICLEEFQLNDSYSKWPCTSKTPHIFHYDCMLNTLRMKNTCPICRYPVEAGQIQNNIYSSFFTELVL
ncbi:unnamed protein product [Rotaria sordida]|uniref:RING-type domain-containing protein n=1 Tax=Rotaria sordida TaxID=392033 RepID=A0A814V003_9BILA|nr:unnamed protein product [Rotaria sordida]